MYREGKIDLHVCNMMADIMPSGCLGLPQIHFRRGYPIVRENLYLFVLPRYKRRRKPIHFGSPIVSLFFEGAEDVHANTSAVMQESLDIF